ncbi:MAG: hypothetical protein M1820_002338 [Bogoriella megaspora]|nr:MAG: hypothetical protein M1820_002338 [Bogoriella megaspora]
MPDDTKNHAACDECRTRKIKCSGSLPSCERCSRQDIKCVYSPKRQMGRPKKRQRQEEAEAEAQDAQADLDATSQNFIMDQTATSQSSENWYAQPVAPTTAPFPGLGFTLLDDGSTEHAPFMPFTEFDPSLNSALNSNIDPSLELSSLSNNGQSPQTSSTNRPRSLALTGLDTQCACLPNIYLMLSELRNFDGCSFPLPLPSIRKAMYTANESLACDTCPKDFSTANQNLHLTCALLATVANGFRRLLQDIDREAEIADAAGVKKAFRIGEMNYQNMHLHTGTLDCPLGFNIELSAPEWRSLARKAVRATYDGNQGAKGLMTIVRDLETRQRKWHLSGDVPHIAPLQHHSKNSNHECEEPICVQMVSHTRRVIEVLGIESHFDT